MKSSFLCCVACVLSSFVNPVINGDWRYVDGFCIGVGCGFLMVAVEQFITQYEKRIADLLKEAEKDEQSYILAMKEQREAIRTGKFFESIREYSE